jgi:hypothetical protein
MSVIQCEMPQKQHLRRAVVWWLPIVLSLVSPESHVAITTMSIGGATDRLEMQALGPKIGITEQIFRVKQKRRGFLLV